MNKADIVEAMRDRGWSKKGAKEALTDLLAVIEEGLTDGHEVRLAGLVLATKLYLPGVN
jgi:nucleoid DNA-binding protein